MSGKKRNIAIQLVSQQSRKTSGRFFIARITVPIASQTENVNYALFKTRQQIEDDFNSISLLAGLVRQTIKVISPNANNGTHKKYGR